MVLKEVMASCRRHPARVIVLVPLSLAAVAVVAAAVMYPGVVRLLLMGDSKPLRDERRGPPAGLTAARSPLLVLAFDGVGRDVLYDLLRDGELPELSALLGGQSGARFPHAYFEQSAITVLPSATMPAWASIFTAATPAQNGVPGDEFFIRESLRFAAPVPVSVAPAKPLASVYASDSVGELLTAPTVYELLRSEEPHVRIWVSMSQVFRGADRLLLGSRSVLVSAFARSLFSSRLARPVAEELTEEIIETIVDELEDSEPPEVLTVYLPLADLRAHHSSRGPDWTVREHLRRVVDPKLGRLRRALESSGALTDRFVVAVADHGHTALLADGQHALEPDTESGPSRVLSGAGFRVRPFTWKTADQSFQAVVAYEGAMAFIYLADRSTCPEPRQRCDWRRAPRPAEDVMAAADAFVSAAADGNGAPDMKGTLDLVLIRTAAGFDVALGAGRSVPLAEHLAAHPRPDDVSMVERLNNLAVGPYASRVGDIVLLARGGDEREIADRYYFASPHHSGHGSPSATDSAIPVIVAHPRLDGEAVERLARRAMRASPRAHDVGTLLLELRRQAR